MVVISISLGIVFNPLKAHFGPQGVDFVTCSRFYASRNGFFPLGVDFCPGFYSSEGLCGVSRNWFFTSGC